MTTGGPVQNTDVEIMRETPGDYYSPSAHVTTDRRLGINVGGTVVVRSLRDWHRAAHALTLADALDAKDRRIVELESLLREVDQVERFKRDVAFTGDGMNIGAWKKRRDAALKEPPHDE